LSHAITDPWTDRLSELLDGSLTGEERGLIDAHLVTCGECRTVLADLQRVVTHARTLPEIAPDEDLWPGIAARVAAFARTDQPPPMGVRMASSWGITMSWPQLVAAGLMLVVLSGGGAWFAAKGRRPSVTAAVQQPAGTTVMPAAQSDPQYAAEVMELQKALDERRGQLDPETVKTIEANLKIIDLATTQARQALAADPANPYLKEVVSRSMKKKVELLKQATVYASTQ
jgi:hypothetical protein